MKDVQTIFTLNGDDDEAHKVKVIYEGVDITEAVISCDIVGSQLLRMLKSKDVQYQFEKLSRELDGQE